LRVIAGWTTTAVSDRRTDAACLPIAVRPLPPANMALKIYTTSAALQTCVVQQQQANCTEPRRCCRRTGWPGRDEYVNMTRQCADERNAFIKKQRRLLTADTDSLFNNLL